jgi:hypothetical protein
MARIASFTSSGTPTGPRSTLAELMARKRMLAEQQGQIMGPRPIESWTQGAAQLGQTLVNALQQRRAASEEAAGREELAGAMSGIDWNTGPTPEQQATIYARDPELGMKIIADMVQARRNAVTTLTPEEEAAAGLPSEGVYQKAGTGAISRVETPKAAETWVDIPPPEGSKPGQAWQQNTVTGEKKAVGGQAVTQIGSGETEFEKKVGEKQATTFDALYNDGIQAAQDEISVGELEKILSTAGTGTGAGLQLWAKQRLGLELGAGVNDLQAADAIIAKLVPAQRAAGSGTMSDRDVALFRSSLPSIWNTPGGNTKILTTMKGLIQYRKQQGEIASQVMNGQITRQEGLKKLMAIPNPLAEYSQIPDANAPAGDGTTAAATGGDGTTPPKGTPPADAGWPEGITEEDIQETLRAHPDVSRSALKESLSKPRAPNG